MLKRRTNTNKRTIKRSEKSISFNGGNGGGLTPAGTSWNTWTEEEQEEEEEEEEKVGHYSPASCPAVAFSLQQIPPPPPPIHSLIDYW